MKDFNKVIILGNVVADPESRVTPNGHSVANFRVATNRRWNDPNGNLQEDTEFHGVVAWEKLAEITGQIIFKGRKVLVEGRLKTRNWEGQDGVRRYMTEIIAENISALGTGKERVDTLEPTGDKAEEKPATQKEVSIEEVAEELETKKRKKSAKKTSPKTTEAGSKSKLEATKKTKEEEITDEVIDDLPF